jgi:hypothetical protein
MSMINNMEPKIPVRIYAPTIQHMLTDGWMAKYWLSRLAGVVEVLQGDRDQEGDDSDYDHTCTQLDNLSGDLQKD